MDAAFASCVAPTVEKKLGVSASGFCRLTPPHLAAIDVSGQDGYMTWWLGESYFIRKVFVIASMSWLPSSKLTHRQAVQYFRIDSRSTAKRLFLLQTMLDRRHTPTTKIACEFLWSREVKRHMSEIRRSRTYSLTCSCCSPI